MRKVKPDSSSDTASQRMRPAITPEARQKQMISLATDCAEDLMRSGKAPSQIIVHPPMSSAVLECYKTQVNEYEWRLKTMAENQEVNNQNE